MQFDVKHPQGGVKTQPYIASKFDISILFSSAHQTPHLQDILNI